MASSIPTPLIKRLAEEIQHAGSDAGLLPPDVAEGISVALLKGNMSGVKVHLKTPRKVSATLSSDLATLDYGMCSKSGKVIELTPQKIAKPYCEDGSYIIPAPVWVVTSSSPNIQPMTTSQPNFKVVKGLSDVVRNDNKLKNMKIKILDKSRPVATLKFEVNGNLEDPLPVITQSAVMRHMITLTPSESITKPVTISAFSYDGSDCITIEPAEELAGIEQLIFCRNLKIIQATLGYRAGHPKSGSRSRIMVFDGAFEDSEEVYNIYVRYIEAPGIVGRIDEDKVKLAIKSLNPRIREESISKKIWTALHTMSHAFLVNLPPATGLNSQDFAEALSMVHGEFAVYDNSPGGLGGIEGVVNTDLGMLDPNFEMKIRSSHVCPLDCTKACKACFYTDSCFMLNWNLDRRIIAQLGWGI